MKKQEIVIKDVLGIHARPAAAIVKASKEFESSFEIEFNGKSVNGKSIMGVMSLGMKCNDEAVITINGDDEEIALTLVIETMTKEGLI